MQNKAKYYQELGAHKLGKTFAGGPLRRIGLTVVFATVGAIVGHDIGSEGALSPDTVASENAETILAELEAEKAQIISHQNNGESVSNIPDMATDLVVRTLLNEDLSEQQRQDFLYDMDIDLIDMSSIGFAALEGCDCDDQVDDLSYLRETRAEIEADPALAVMNDHDKAVALAEGNKDKTPMSPLFLSFFLMLAAGLTGTVAANEGRKLGERKPRKPLKYGDH